MYKNLPTLEQFEEAFKDGKVSRSESDDYVLFKYKKEIQFAKEWNDLTLNARGIIFDLRTKECVALPFRKFFNLNETGCHLSEIKNDSRYEILEKMDGSMGCVFMNRDKNLCIATPGSFLSDQALWATNWIRNFEKYEVIREKFLNGELKTLVVEIICHLSKVVVPYNFEGLVIIAAQKVIGDNVRYMNHYNLTNLSNEVGLSVCRNYSFPSIFDIKSHLGDIKDFEGFVLHWPETGYRVKMKAEEYMRQHRIITSIHPNRIDEAIESSENDFFKIQENVWKVIESFPEEYVEPYKIAVEEFCEESSRIWSDILSVLREYKDSTPKELALHLKGGDSYCSKEFSDTYFGYIMNAHKEKYNYNKFASKVWSEVRKKNFSIELEEIQ